MATSAPENLLAHITYYSCSFPWDRNWNGGENRRGRGDFDWGLHKTLGGLAELIM